MFFSDRKVSNVELARLDFFKAENENGNWKLKLDLYLSASKNYLKAAELIVGDRMAVDALIFLSNSSLHKAELANTILVTVSPGSSNEKGSISVPPIDSEIKFAVDNNTGDSLIDESSSSGRILLHPNNKKMGGSSRMRISGLICVPTASALSPSDAANDLFFLEKKLAELGLMSGVSPSYRNTGTLRSALGESFMLLSTSSLKQSKICRAQQSAHFNTSDKSLPQRSPQGLSEIQSWIVPDIDITNKESFEKKKGINLNGIDNSSENKNNENSRNSSNTTFSDAVGGPYGGLQKSKVKSQPKNSPLVKQKQNNNTNTFWLPNPLDILTWRGAVGTTTTNRHIKEASNIANKNDTEGNQFDLQWNDDLSMYGSTAVEKHAVKSSSKDSKVISVSPASNDVDSSINIRFKDDDDNNNSNNHNDDSDNYGVNDTTDSSKMPESILRLLQCIKRLGDENMSLLQRIDLLSTVEAKNMSLHKEMVGFKKEYEDRFGKLKEILREFHRRNPGDNLKGIMFDPQHNSPVPVISCIAGSDQNSKSKEEHRNAEASPAKEQSNSLEGQGCTQQRQQEMRQQQLERTVLALVKRLEQSKSDVDKRDRLIGKYEKYYKQLKREAERREIERNGEAVPVTDNSSSGHDNTSNRQQNASNPGQQYQQQRAPSMMPARNKHPSISTLETTLGLQRERAAGASRYSSNKQH